MTPAPTVDPDIVAAGRRAAEVAPPLDFRSRVENTPEELRTAYADANTYWNRNGPPLPSIVNLALRGPHGELRVRAYRPSTGDSLPVLLYLHGGGFVLGSVDTHDRLCRILARDAGVVVVSVDYRLAPEHRFPVAIEECLFACDWILDQGASFGGDPGFLAVGGDSAGANLALNVLNERRPSVSTALLFYGCHGHLPEYGFPLGPAGQAFGDGRYGLGLDIMRRFYADYLDREEDGLDPRFCQLRMDLRGLPPVLVAATELDPLRDDAEALRRGLDTAGVSYRYIQYPGTPHGFLKMAPEVPIAAKAIRDAADHLQSIWNP